MATSVFWQTSAEKLANLVINYDNGFGVFVPCRVPAKRLRTGAVFCSQVYQLFG